MPLCGAKLWGVSSLSGITINTARKVVSRATRSRAGMIQEHIQLLRYASRAHGPHSACIERLPAIACMLAQTPAALVRRWVYRACSIRGVNTDNCPRYLAVQTSSGLFGEPRPFMLDHALLGRPASAC